MASSLLPGQTDHETCDEDQGDPVDAIAQSGGRAVIEHGQGGHRSGCVNAVRTMPKACPRSFHASNGSPELGQPVPLSNFVAEKEIASAAGATESSAASRGAAGW
jgi:hypothetical protein